MRKKWLLWSVLAGVMLWTSMGLCAYHHEGEQDAAKFLSVYPGKAGTKLDHCALCHSGGQYTNSKGALVNLGSCQWCHYSYGYDGSGNILDTLNAYGEDYHDNGRNAAAISTIGNLDSDGDGYLNSAEIDANRFPGDAGDDPSQTVAPARVYTRAQLEAMAQHRQFLLMNTSRSGDFYAEYTGVPMEDLLVDAGILPSATGITVFAPDGWSQYHPLEEDTAQAELYHVNGTYPASTYSYHEEADENLNPVDGWCDYSAPSCLGRSHGDPIAVTGGLKLILAYAREGLSIDPGILNEDNKLDGEGPFRVVPPQKNPNPPDQSSRASNQSVVWPYEHDWDHNAGAATRSVTIIRVEPLPAGTTDINILEAGWSYIDNAKIIVYGAIDGTDSNGNGVLDSEEGSDPGQDVDNDGIPDYQDTDTARVRFASGGQNVLMHTTAGAFTQVRCLSDDDPEVPQTGKPNMQFPYGTVDFSITGLAVGQSVDVALTFPANVPTDYKYYKISAASGWTETPFASNDGDNVIVLTLTDGDPATDADGVANGVIEDPGALAASVSSGSGGGGGGCFITSTAPESSEGMAGWILSLGCCLMAAGRFAAKRVK